jgi:hypothetical protein
MNDHHTPALSTQDRFFMMTTMKDNEDDDKEAGALGMLFLI